MDFNPQRLGVARKRRLFNKIKLAKAVGVTPRTLVRWDKDLAIPTPENINACAQALRFPAEFFFGPDVDEPDLESTSFRSQTSMTAAMRDAATAAGSIGFLISDWVEKRFDLPTGTLPDLHSYDPVSAARALREEWCLGEQPISNMVHLLESKGTKVFSLAENTAKVNAYALWRNDKPYVFLNTWKSSECSRFDAAHELGHLVLHQDGKAKGRAAEEQAHLFASAFLMPESDMYSNFRRGGILHLEHLVQAKRRWKVSVGALNYRCNRLGLISDWKYRDFCIEMVRKGYNKKEPNEVERERSVVWAKVIQALWSEGTTHAEIARELSVPKAEVEGLLFEMLNSQKTGVITSGPQTFSIVTPA